MKKLNIKNIALFLLGCLLIGIFIYFIIVKNIFNLQGFVYITVTVLFLAVCGLVIYLMTFLIIKAKQKSDDDSITFTFNGGGKDNLIAQINQYLIKIKQLNNYIKDEVISCELDEIEKSLRTIQSQLKEETVSESKIKQLEEFFNYYMPLIVKILNSYRRIESNELTGENATETKNQVSSIIPLIKKAFEKELDYMFTDEMLDITSDIKVLELMLSTDGLLGKNNGT